MTVFHFFFRFLFHMYTIVTDILFDILVLKRTQGGIPFERGPVFSGQIYEKVGISLVEVYEKVAKSFITM